MSAGDASQPPPPPPPRPRPIAELFESVGVPQSVTRYRPRLPSRNWLIFLSVTGSLLGSYIYDRRQCRLIRDSYKARVAHLAEEPLATHDLPRKVTVYTCKSPSDDDYQRSMRFFKKYVKPVLVSAAVDYEIVNGRRYGDLANIIAEKIKTRRRIAAGLDPEPPSPIPIPMQMTPAQKLAREAEGGTVVIGRHSFKEFMHGTRQGWTESLERVDKEEELAQELSTDGVFDEREEDDAATSDKQDGDAPSKPFQPPVIPGLLPQVALPQATPRKTTVPAELDQPPAVIPQQPPLLLVPFSNLIGFRNVPWMIADFFNERARVRVGCDAAYRLVMAQTRPFDARPGGDLDFDLKQEEEYLPAFVNLPDEDAKARNKYYEALTKKIATARELSRGTREPTRDERNFPPPTEVELRAERLKKEQRWRADHRGWSILRPGAPPAWDDRFARAFSVYAAPKGDEGKPADAGSDKQ